MSSAETKTYMTSSGTKVNVIYQGEDRPDNRLDATRLWYSVQVNEGQPQRVAVVVDAPDLIELEVLSRKLPSLSIFKADLGTLAIMSAVEGNPDSDLSTTPNLEVNPQGATKLLSRQPASNREIRRYIARKAYATFARSTLDSVVVFDYADFSLLGGNRWDVMRNAQVLQEENYLTIQTAGQSSTAVVVTPRATLVRDVERYGATKEDAVLDRDYGAILGAYPALGEWSALLLMERRRYETAVTSVELESVFRGVAPIVEAVAKLLLTRVGSVKNHSTLGPVIAELQERGIGGPSLLTQLNHILKFGRDLAQHGVSLPEPVLRIACANAFELIPQLAALMPVAG